MSTQVARPAKAAGLVPRTKAEITSEAAAKKAQKNAKAQRVTEKKARIAEGVAKLGRLQQERIASDAAEERDLRTARPVQDDGPGVQEVRPLRTHLLSLLTSLTCYLVAFEQSFSSAQCQAAPPRPVFEQFQLRGRPRRRSPADSTQVHTSDSAVSR